MSSKITKPVIIIGAPRSGTTLLFTLLNSHPEVFSLYEESRFIFHKYYKRKLKLGINFPDDTLKPEDCTSDDIKAFKKNFHKYSFRNRFLGLAFNKIIRKKFLLKNLAPCFSEINAKIKNIFYKKYRLIEKTPRNCFKIELLHTIFPDAKFIFLKRDPRSNISSLIEGWKRRSTKYQGDSKRLPKVDKKLQLSNFTADSWRFVLPPGWQDYINGSLEELCAYQWKKSIEAILEDFQYIPKDQKITISYEELTTNTHDVLQQVCKFAELDFHPKLAKLAQKPPEVNYLDSRPQADKWRKNEDAINKVIPGIKDIALILDYDLKS